MRVLLAGGGTGGHVIPALAIANALRERFRDPNFGQNSGLSTAEIRFVGTARGMETRLVPQAGYPLDLIAVGQLNRVSLATQLKTLAILPRGIFACIRLVRRWRPQVVVGVGGYASGPAMLAATLLRVPTLAFEPNATPGLANRLIGKHVSGAAVNFPSTLSYFRNAEVTGIPVRAEFFALRAKSLATSPRLLILGGSQGARALNERMPRVAKALLDSIAGLTILHQAGARHAEATEAAYTACGASPARWRVAAFVEDMPAQFGAADLILARSGASTVAELAAAGKPSLLVPFPQAADDHQRKNAEELVRAGAAVMLTEQEMTEAALLEALQRLLRERHRLLRMADCARTLAHPNAAQHIAEKAAVLARSIGKQ